MKKLFMLAAIPAFILLIASCSKESVTTTITVKQLTSIRTSNSLNSTFMYDRKGMLEKITRTFKSNGDSSYTTWSFTYNADGNLAGFNKSCDGTLASTCTITYTEMARTAIIDQNGPVGKIEQRLDADGNPISEVSYYYENGAWVKEGESTLKWANGNLMETVYDGSYTTTYEYDNRVNPLYGSFKGFISVSNLYDNDLALIPSKNNATKSSFLEMTFSYDEQNYPTEAEVLVKTGWFQSKEIHTYTYANREIIQKN